MITKTKLILRFKGGPGSGDFGHRGRPGQVGGSSGGGNSYKTISARNFQAGGKMNMGNYDMNELRNALENDYVSVRELPGGYGEYRVTDKGREHFGMPSLNKPKSSNFSSRTAVAELKKLQTNDFQKRNGKGNLKSDVADSFNVTVNGKKVTVRAEFKNTSESSAKQWLERFVASHVGNIKSAKNYQAIAYQTGDYEDDWVVADISFDLED